MQRRQVDLETFLADLPAESAAKAKAAAARIDELEHAAQRIGQSDTAYMRLLAISGVLFLIAAGMLFSGQDMFADGTPQLSDIVVLVMAGALPVMVFVYCFKMNERTKIDRIKFQIIEDCFLPYDAIYLPPGPDRESGMVAIADRTGGWSRVPEDEKKFKRPGWYW